MRKEITTSPFLSISCWQDNRPPILAGLGKDETERDRRTVSR
jgi:hypothetical protein